MPTHRKPKVFRLRRNHSTETPGALVFVDTEAHERVVRESPRRSLLSFRLGCATYLRYERGKVSRREQFDFDDWQEFWEWLESKETKQRPLWVLGHNLGFDLTLMHFWEMLQLGRYRAGSIAPEVSNGVLSGKRPWRGKLVIDGFPFYVYCMGTRGFVRFVDTLNFYPKSLASIGDSLGFSKLEFPGFAAPDAAMREYCRRDVDITERLMVDTLNCWRESDGGVFQPTAAMLALTSFRHKLPRTKRPAGDPTILYDAKDDWQELERAAYYGGQTSCFYVGSVLALDLESRGFTRVPRLEDVQRPQGPLYLLDVRSLYPSLMRDNKFPFRRLNRLRNPDPAELLALLNAYGVIASVTINSDSDEYTLRTDKGQLQAVGRFDTALCGPELERALKAGHVERVHQAQVYCMDYLFRDWVDDWVRVRDEADRLGDKVRADYAKMILNALSGKFAQHGEHWVERPNLTPPCDYGPWVEIDAESGGVRRFRAVAGLTQERVASAPPWYTFPSISAYVTSHGREHMRWLRAQCPPGTVLYQATDSLVVTSEARFALEGLGLIRERGLGYLEIRHQGEDGEIVGCNQYRIGEKWVRSGAWGTAERHGDGKYYYTTFQGVKSVVETQPDGTVRVDVTEVANSGAYPKGKVTGSGWVEWPRLGADEVPF